jgi:hypothetical protein
MTRSAAIEEGGRSVSNADAVLSSVDAHKIVDLCGQLIQISSFKTEETAVARWLGDYFSRRGYEVNLQEVDAGRYQIFLTARL